MTKTINRTLTREEERQIVAFLANSDELARIAAADLKDREARRGQILDELARDLPNLERASEAAAAKAEKAVRDLEQSREEFQRVKAACDEARIRAGSAQSVFEKAKANARRFAAEMADPRIDDLRRWVLRLEREVRAEPVEISLTLGTPERVRKQMETDAAQKSNRASIAMTRLDVIAAELLDLMVSPYGPELASILIDKQAEAQEIARLVIAAHRFEVLMESAPDMSRLPLPRG
jgi:hypothetical protein